MELKEKDIMIVVEDGINFGDALNSQSIRNRESPIKGHVQMYEIVNGEKKLIFEKDNLVVYCGREWVASRIFNKTNTHLVPPCDSTADEFICWLGLGSGGTTIVDPFDPAPPSSTNTDLVTEIIFSIDDPTSHLGDLRVDGYYKHKLHDVIFETDINNASKYLIAQIQIDIGSSDANGFLISEAALFTAASAAAGYSGDFHLFARVTFPSIYKSEDRLLFFVWYLYC